MEISERQMSENALAKFGSEALKLLRARDFEGLANRFGYMRAFHRLEDVALEADLSAAIKEAVGNLELKDLAQSSVSVKYLTPNEVFLSALIECRALTEDARGILLELVVIDKDGSKHLCIEDISSEY